MARLELRTGSAEATREVGWALAGSLRHRRAGALIRQALAAFLLDEPRVSRRMLVQSAEVARTNHGNAADEATAARILERSADLFGF